MSTQSDNGFFGKLPALGDFVQRRLPALFINPWDQWLQDAIAASRAELGESWLDLYLTSPVWRFALAPGVAGQASWAGVLMPSVDRVGRYFPLTLACPLPASANLVCLLQMPRWFDRAEELALSTLDDGFELETFDSALSALEAPNLVINPEPSGDGLDAWHLGVPKPNGFGAACPTLLSRALGEVFLSYTLWWTSGSEHVAPSLLCCQGLPTPQATMALMTGEWSSREWLRLGDIS
jgi:type VI secretion system protein ImpM